MCGLLAFKEPLAMTTDTTIETASGALDGADEPCPAIGANLIALMPKEARGRFVERFAEKTRLNPETGCVEWTGGLSKDGYGMVWIPAGAVSEAHRVAYVLACGPIPAGQKVLHYCHNRRCVNPVHLRLGTAADNARDMTDAGRGMSGPGSNPRKLCPVGALIVIGDQLLGVPVVVTARELGVTHQTVTLIRAGKLWRAAVSAHLDAVLTKTADPADPA